MQIWCRAVFIGQFCGCWVFFILFSWLPTFFTETFPTANVSKISSLCSFLQIPSVDILELGCDVLWYFAQSVKTHLCGTMCHEQLGVQFNSTFYTKLIQYLFNSVVNPVKAVYSASWENPSQSYGMSLAIWDHTVLPATWHKWTRPALTPTRQAGSRFTYPRGMEG